MIGDSVYGTVRRTVASLFCHTVSFLPLLLYGASTQSGNVMPKLVRQASSTCIICARVNLPRYAMTRHLSIVLICSKETIDGSRRPLILSKYV